MGRPGQKVKQKGLAFVLVLAFVLILATAATAFIALSGTEIRMVRRQCDSTRAFYIAEGGFERTRYNLGEDGDWMDGEINGFSYNKEDVDSDAFYLLNYDYATKTSLGGKFTVRLKNVVGKTDEIKVKSTGTFNTATRAVEVIVEREFPWSIPAAMYANGLIKAMKFDKRDDAYIDGGNLPGIYATDDVKTKKKGEGRIMGNPPILEYQEVPEGMEDGVWEAFDLDRLRQIAKDNGTYFGGDEYNKKGKYTLPVEEGKTKGVFFFDAKDGGVLDDDEINPKNEAKVELKGTTEQISGIIVVVGDLTIKDTKDYDFLFDGIIIVLDDLKMDDNRHGRRDGSNDSDILIRGAILSDNIIEKGKGRKKKPSIDIKNATIEYDSTKVLNAAPFWDIAVASWQEI